MSDTTSIELRRLAELVQKLEVCGFDDIALEVRNGADPGKINLRKLRAINAQAQRLAGKTLARRDGNV